MISARQIEEILLDTVYTSGCESPDCDVEGIQDAAIAICAMVEDHVASTLHEAQLEALRPYTAAWTGVAVRSEPLAGWIMDVARSSNKGEAYRIALEQFRQSMQRPSREDEGHFCTCDTPDSHKPYCLLDPPALTKQELSQWWWLAEDLTHVYEGDHDSAFSDETILAVRLIARRMKERNEKL